MTRRKTTNLRTFKFLIRVTIFVSTLLSCSMSARGCFEMRSMSLKLYETWTHRCSTGRATASISPILHAERGRRFVKDKMMADFDFLGGLVGVPWSTRGGWWLEWL